MNYKWHYDKLIETRRARTLVAGVYYEKHHIIMKSMGGTNKENLVLLTATGTYKTVSNFLISYKLL